MAPLYARYVPPKATKIDLPLSPASLPPRVPSVENAPESTPEKGKKRKRTIEQPYPALDSGDGITSKLEGQSVQPSSTKKERTKKRKRETKPVEPGTEGDNGPVSQKHKAVLTKFARSTKVAEVVRERTEDKVTMAEQNITGTEELHDLVPLPQPQPVLETPYEPTFSDLPSWLANPTTVPAGKQTPFRNLGLDDRFVSRLEKKGYPNALAVQSQLIPMLRPGPAQHVGDLCVLAKTGSGKTMAYLLPMIETMRDRTATKLSVIVIVPTRILVDQARAVAEELCGGTRLKVGTAVGDIPFAVERKALVNVCGHYHPERSADLHRRAKEQWNTGFIERGGIFDDLVTLPANHFPQYESKVDILICTPGRLLEHLQSTTGFLLRDVQWVVFDEADQLLDHSFHDWASVLMDALYNETPADFKNAREQLCKLQNLPVLRNPTKVILSATLTKDLAKLHVLRLQRPKLVVVQDEASRDAFSQQNTSFAEDSFELPSTLKEFAVPVGDGSDKPLYLLHLLQSTLLREPEEEDPSVHSGSDSDSDSDSDESSSDSDSSSNISKDASFSSVKHSTKVSDVQTSTETPGPTAAEHRVLIFTKSNENAARLARLLPLLAPSLTKKIGALTRGAAHKSSRKLLKTFTRGKIQILIASDRASRGLDVPDLTHVVNYDMPSNITRYVHRVGRTARAEKSGEAWTLFTKSEGRWFWTEIAKGATIRRGTRAVERVNVQKDAITTEKEEAYKTALAALQEAVQGDSEKPKNA